MNTSVKEINNIWLAAFVVGAGLVRRPEPQKLLMAPVNDLPSRRNTSTNFDEYLEADYLGRLPREDRIGQLVKEVVTTLKEVHFSQFGHNYRLESGHLLDGETGQDVERLTMNGGTKEEILAISKIKLFFTNGADIVVNISPEDRELGYPDNMVDIWLRCNDGKIRVIRYKTVGDLETFKRFYRDVGGVTVNPTKDQILSDPVVPRGLKLADVLNLLVIEKSEAKFRDKDIEIIANRMLDDFRRSFGDRLISDPNIIMRYYLAVKLEVDKLKKKGVEITESMVSNIIRDMPIDTYLNAKFTIKTEKGAGCANGTPGGQFESQGWILVVVNGKLCSYLGSTEGMTYCERCGCWHRGDNCPFCDLGYAANC